MRAFIAALVLGLTVCVAPVWAVGIMQSGSGADDDVPESGDFGNAAALESDGSLSADAVDALTEVAQGIKTAANDTSKLVVGTAGSTSELASWDANGNLVDPDVILGTMTDGKLCGYTSTGTVIDCDNDPSAVGADSIGTTELDDAADTPGSGEYIRVDTVDQAGIEYRTAAETRADIGANDASNLSTGTLPAARLGADSIDAITEVASALKSGADGTFVTGTAGTASDLAIWNADGDLVDGPTPPSGTIVGTTDTQTLENKTVTTPTLTLQDGNAADPTTDGQLKYDRTTEVLEIGDGASTQYAAKGASDGDAQAGDSATGFFDAGTLEHERGGFEADVSAFSGLLSVTGGATEQVTTKAGVEALLSDVADIAEADGDAYTGAHDFGGADDLEVPNDATPTVDTAGQVAVDTSADDFKYYGTAARVLTYQKAAAITLESPADADNFLWFKAPYALTISDIECIVDPADSSESVVITVQETDGDGDSPAGVDGATTITCANTTTSDDGALSNGTIDADDFVALDIGTVTGTVTQLNVRVKFTKDAE